MTEQDITNLILARDDAVERAILAIYKRQTTEEQLSGETMRLNGMGFSGSDARLGSYYAKWLLSGKHLSGQHLMKARKMAFKYRGQLLLVAQGK